MRRALLILAVTATVAVAGFESASADTAEGNERVADDIDVKRLVLDILKGKRFDTDIAGSVLEARIRETMTGAPTLTLTIHDPDFELLESDVLFETDKDGDREVRDIDIQLEKGRWYRLQQVTFGPSSQGRGVDLVLTFEHRLVALLRRYRKPKKARRARMTRAEFVRSFAREVKGVRVVFRSRELHKEQPLARKSKEDRDRDRDPGLGDGERVEVKGRRATSTQRKVIDDVLSEGARQNARDKVLITGIMTITQESSASNSATNGVHVGAFQQNRAMGWPATRNATLDSRAFFRKAIAIDRANPSMSKASLAEAVQRSGQGSLYAQWEGEATRTVKAFGGTGSESRSRTKPYTFTRGRRGKHEDSWTAANRLASEVNWRCFITGKNAWYFESEPNLFKARPRMRIDRDHPAVLGVSGDLDKGKRAKTLTVSARIKRWTAPVGSVVTVEGYGVDGRWLVESIERSLYSTAGDITLKKPSKPKPEPRPETVSVGSGSDDGTGSGKAAKLYQIVQKFHGPYVWGGGHGPPLKDVGFSSGMDCSSSCAKALYEAGLYGHDVAFVSGQFAAQYGEAGEGRVMTVWAHSGHVFIELKGLGHIKRFDTSPQGGETERGPRARTQMRSTAGFTPRHWPGL